MISPSLSRLRISRTPLTPAAEEPITTYFMAENRELLHRQLPRADPGYALRPIFRLQLLELVRHIMEALVPGYRFHRAVRLLDLRKRVRLNSRLLLVQRQALNTAETIVHGVAFNRHSFHHAVIFHIKIKITVDRAIIAWRSETTRIIILF